MEKETFQLGENALTLSEATVLVDLRRSRLMKEAIEQPDPDPDRQTLRFAYANCYAPVTDWGGLAPMGFEDFCNLKGALVDGWLNTAYRLNPEWEPPEEKSQDQAGDTDEKKVSS